MLESTADSSELGNASTASLSSTRGGEPPGPDIEKAALGGAADSNTQVAAGEAVRNNNTTDFNDSGDGAPSTSDADDDVTPDEALYEVECEASAGITERLPLPRALDTVAGKYYAAPVATINRVVCDHYLHADNLARLRTMTPEMVKDGLLGLINETISTENLNINAKEPVASTLLGAKRVPIARLSVVETARVMDALHTIVTVAPSERNSDPDLDMLAVYDADPASETYGTYRTSQGHIRALARRYCPDLATKEFIELLAALTDTAPRRFRGTDRDLLAVRNGIINYNGGKPTFREFSPHDIFLSKLDVDWNPDATSPVYPNPDGCSEGHGEWVCSNGHSDLSECDEDECGPVPECSAACLEWEVESWMAEFFPGDHEQTELLWEIMGAVVRPYVSWNKAAFFYSEKGNNGKGTLVSLARNLVGSNSYATIPLSDFGKDFMLEPLTRASAILVDENDVGTFIDKVANLKAVVTNDVIAINRKYKDPIAYQFFGFMIQCLNDMPRVSDKSESFYRRQVFIEFTKSFTGRERKYIKDDYLTRPAVLEYVLKRALTMTYYDLRETEATTAALGNYKANNDAVQAYFEEVFTQIGWSKVPIPFNHELYKAWVARAGGSGAKWLSERKFATAFRSIAESHGWTQTTQTTSTEWGADAEPLMREYPPEGWVDTSKGGATSAKMLPGKARGQYRCWVRPKAERVAREKAAEAEREAGARVLKELVAETRRPQSYLEAFENAVPRVYEVLQEHERYEKHEALRKKVAEENLELGAQGLDAKPVPKSLPSVGFTLLQWAKGMHHDVIDPLGLESTGPYPCTPRVRWPGRIPLTEEEVPEWETCPQAGVQEYYPALNMPS